MGHIDINGIDFVLPDGRPLLDGVSFRVADGSRTALIGPNGAGKTTLLRIVAGDIPAASGAVVTTGGMGVMRQFVGKGSDDRTIRDLLVELAPEKIRVAALALADSELALMEDDSSERVQMRYAQAIADWVDVGGYEAENDWDKITMDVLSIPFERAQFRELRTLSGGEQKRLALESLLRGPDEVLLLDEPDNFLDVPTKRWLESALTASGKTILFISHDRELLANTATHIASLEPTAAGSHVWVHGGGFATFGEAQAARRARLDELRRRWDEEHTKLRELVKMYKIKAAVNADMASRLQAARTRLAKFEEAGPPQAVTQEQNVKVRLRGGRTAKRAVVCTDLELTGLMKPFDIEIWYGERVAVLGSNGSGKSHFLRLLAAGGSDPEPEQRPVDDAVIERVRHSGRAVLGSRVRPGYFRQNYDHPELVGRTLLEILHRGGGSRRGMSQEEAARALDRYELAHASEQLFETLSGGQQARMQILLLELSGTTLLLLDEPTDNLDLHSAEALEAGLAAFDGTVLAVTHDRWFTRGFDRFLLLGSDQSVTETDEPVWEVSRVERVR